MKTARPKLRSIALLGLLLASTSLHAAPAAEEAVKYVEFVQDFASTCVQRNGVQIQVRNSHPQRTVRVWMDRFHMGVGTGDRSRSELKPGAEPEPLGCSRTMHGTQEWRIVRAQFVD